MCDDVHATVAELSAKGATFAGGVEEMGYGLQVWLVLPSGGRIGHLPAAARGRVRQGAVTLGHFARCSGARPSVRDRSPPPDPAPVVRQPLGQPAPVELLQQRHGHPAGGAQRLPGLR